MEEDIADLISMGFERGKVETTLLCCGTKEEAIDLLLSQQFQNVGTGSSSVAFEEDESDSNTDTNVDDADTDIEDKKEILANRNGRPNRNINLYDENTKVVPSVRANTILVIVLCQVWLKCALGINVPLVKRCVRSIVAVTVCYIRSVKHAHDIKKWWYIYIYLQLKFDHCTIVVSDRFNR